MRPIATTCPAHVRARAVATGQVQFVSSFAELVNTPLTSTINAVCWERVLPGDFAAISASLGDSSSTGMITLEPALLRELQLKPEGCLARQVLLDDLALLSALHLDPALNCIFSYAQDERPGPIKTDVFSFHVDSAPFATDTWLCTYHGPTSEGLSNSEAQRHVDIPATRAVLLADHGGADDAGFEQFLTAQAYDLHYAPGPQARPYQFGVGQLWRIATQYPGSSVLPCIHRAPPPGPHDPPRLLLIS